MEGMKNSQVWDECFSPRFDACISSNIQQIDLKVKTLVDLDLMIVDVVFVAGDDV